MKYVICVGRTQYAPDIVTLDSTTVSFQDTSGYLSFNILLINKKFLGDTLYIIATLKENNND